MASEETKRFDMENGDTANPDLIDPSATKKLPTTGGEDDSGETRALEPIVIDPNATKHLDMNGLVATHSLVPKRLRVVMPDNSELVFDNLHPHLLVGRKSSVNTRHIDIDLSEVDKGVFGVSRIHAMILPDDRHGLVIKDLQSVNGTYINGKKLRQNEDYPLAPGDTVKFGNLKVQLLFDLGK